MNYTKCKKTSDKINVLCITLKIAMHKPKWKSV